MQRILDLDLDFFLNGVAYFRPTDSERLDDEDFQPWSFDQAVGFLAERCGLQSKLPGWTVEGHGDLFDRWRSAIQSGLLRPPFHVTHVDAHADLGLGDSG